VRSAHQERLRCPGPMVSGAARSAAQSACSHVCAPVLKLHALSTQQPRPAAFRNGTASPLSEVSSDIVESTARPSACLAEAAEAHAVRGPAGVAGHRGRRGARRGALVRARPPLRAHLALLARQHAALGPWRRAVAGRHVLLRIRALQNLRFCRLRGGRRCSQSTQPEPASAPP